jgi:hypothetical protein
MWSSDLVLTGEGRCMPVVFTANSIVTVLVLRVPVFVTKVFFENKREPTGTYLITFIFLVKYALYSCLVMLVKVSLINASVQ